MVVEVDTCRLLKRAHALQRKRYQSTTTGTFRYFSYESTSTLHPPRAQHFGYLAIIIMGFMRARRGASSVAPAHPLEDATTASSSCSDLSTAEAYQASLRIGRSRSSSSLTTRRTNHVLSAAPSLPSLHPQAIAMPDSKASAKSTTISCDVAIQCSRMWSWNGQDVSPPCSSSLMARLERVTGGAAADDCSKAVQVELPWLTHQIRRPRIVDPADLSPPPKTEIERKLKRWLLQQRTTCSCTLVHVCAMAAFQPALALSPDRPVPPKLRESH